MKVSEIMLKNLIISYHDADVNLETNNGYDRGYVDGIDNFAVMLGFDDFMDFKKQALDELENEVY